MNQATYIVTFVAGPVLRVGACSHDGAEIKARGIMRKALDAPLSNPEVAYVEETDEPVVCEYEAKWLNKGWPAQKKGEWK